MDADVALTQFRGCKIVLTHDAMSMLPPQAPLHKTLLYSNAHLSINPSNTADTIAWGIINHLW